MRLELNFHLGKKWSWVKATADTGRKGEGKSKPTTLYTSSTLPFLCPLLSIICFNFWDMLSNSMHCNSPNEMKLFRIRTLLDLLFCVTNILICTTYQIQFGNWGGVLCHLFESNLVWLSDRSWSIQSHHESIFAFLAFCKKEDWSTKWFKDL